MRQRTLDLMRAMLGGWVLLIAGFFCIAAIGQETNRPPRSEGSKAQAEDLTVDKASEKQPPVQESKKKNSIPSPKTKYLGRTIAQTMSFHGASWLVRSEREQEERPSQVLPQLGLKPGMTVCDMGCGNGFYSIEIAKQIAPGKVLAVDIQPEMLHLLKLRCDEAQIKNVEPVQGTVIDPQLAPNTVDLVLMVDVYHEFSHPEHMLRSIRSSLKPNGLIALLEYREEDPRVPIKPAHKMSKKQILKEYSANGFRLAKQYDELPWQHLMFFEVDPNWQPHNERSKSESESESNNQ